MPSPLHEVPPPRTLFRVAHAAALLGALAACDIPGTAPIVDTRWAVPVDSTRFGVDDLLPGDVTVTPDSSAFVVDFDPVSFGTSLGAICPPCALADGLTVPKPPFTDSFGSAIDFPPEVSALTILDGSIVVQVTNGLNFDPLNPSAAGPSGSFSIEIRDSADGDLVATGSVDGDTLSFPPGQTLEVVLDLEPVTLDGGFDAEVTVDSPAGDPITIDASLSLSVDASVVQVLVSDVAIDVSGESVTLDSISLDLDELGEEVQDRVTSGALVLEVQNPFGVGADFQVTITGATMPTIQKSLSLVGNAQESAQIDFTTSEIAAILGEATVSLTGGATIDPAAGIVTVRPGQELVIDATLDFVLRVGG